MHSHQRKPESKANREVNGDEHKVGVDGYSSMVHFNDKLIWELECPVQVSLCWWMAVAVFCTLISLFGNTAENEINSFGKELFVARLSWFLMHPLYSELRTNIFEILFLNLSRNPP